MRRAMIAFLVSGTLVAACSSGAKNTQTAANALIVVNAPFASTPSVAEPIARGVELAVEQLNRSGWRLRVVRLDNDNSPTTSVANVRKAVEQGAVGIVDEGTGVDASWPVANAAG